MNDQVKLARSNERIEMIKATKEVLLHPAVLAIAGVILVEYLQSHVAGQGERDANNRQVEPGRRIPGGGFIGSVAGSTLEFALSAMLVAPLAQTIMNKTNEQVEAKADLAGKLLPLLLTKGVG